LGFFLWRQLKLVSKIMSQSNSKPATTYYCHDVGPSKKYIMGWAAN
jgi:hypothetical protein